MRVRSKKKVIESNRPSDASIGKVAKKGDIITRLSFIIFGLGNLLNKQFARAVVFLAAECIYIMYMINFGFSAIQNFITLGTKEQGTVYNEVTCVYETVSGDNSMLCLLYGVITILLTIFIIFVACQSAKSAYCTQVRKERGMKVPKFIDDLRSLKEENLHSALLAFPIIGILTFTIIPLIFMIMMAFTNYDRDHQPPGKLFHWVGMENFGKLLANGSKLAKTFWPVLGWTLIWAVCATITTYFLGVLLALLINRNGTKAKGFWRFTFALSIAVPQFVTLISMRTIFNANGPVNVILRQLHLIGATSSVPFFTDGTLAKITIICINIWIGVPYTMLSTTGILQNIPADLYEAAKIDGANGRVMFRKITMPYMIFVMTPSLITSFTGNINNFNVIFLLSGGGPDSLDFYYAGKTDLLITWLYRLTITQKDYNLGAVIGILVFLIMATLALVTYRRTASYKDEGAFQ